MKKKTAATGVASVLGLALIAQSKKRERRRKEEERLKRQMYSSFFRTIEFGAPKRPPWTPPMRIPPLPEIPPPNTDDVQPIPDEEPDSVPDPTDIVPEPDPGPIPEGDAEDFFPEGGPKWRYDTPWRVRLREMWYRMRPANYEDLWGEFKKTDEYKDYRRQKGLQGPYGERGPEGPSGA